MKYSIIVEGWSDEERIRLVFPKLEIIVTGGTKFNNKIKSQIEFSIASGNTPLLLTDPDTAGDQLADMIMSSYDFKRIIVDVDRAKINTPFGTKYGIEYCSKEYIRELLREYVE